MLERSKMHRSVNSLCTGEFLITVVLLGVIYCVAASDCSVRLRRSGCLSPVTRW
jgi:hypothetical protein